jgi:hypothetical protein
MKFTSFEQEGKAQTEKIFVFLLPLRLFLRRMESLLMHRCHTEFCVTVYNEKVLNLGQPWPRRFSALCHYTKFGMVSKTARRRLPSLYFQERQKAPSLHRPI